MLSLSLLVIMVPRALFIVVVLILFLHQFQRPRRISSSFSLGLASIQTILCLTKFIQTNIFFIVYIFIQVLNIDILNYNLEKNNYKFDQNPQNNVLF
jgi:DNA polymerase sigma